MLQKGGKMEQLVTIIRETLSDDGCLINLKAEKLIQCRDCKHWMPYDWMFSEVWRSVDMDDYSDDEIGCAYCDMNMHANDFCSRAERREDDKH